MTNNNQNDQKYQGHQVQEENMASLTLRRSEQLTEKVIKSFVFFDLETTDLIKHNKCPKITEMALVAVSRNHLVVPQKKLPRVLAKLVIPISPNTEIPYIVTKITKLTNTLLESTNPFDTDVYCQVIHFLRRLEQPICFVAHNGKAFDFPIILKEFRDLNQEMPSEILSIDSIDVFRNYFSEQGLLKRQKLESDEPNNEILEKYDSLLKDSWDDAVSAALDKVETFPSFDEGIELEKTERNISQDKNKEIYSQMQKVNEKTPESQIIKADKIIITTPSATLKPQLLQKPANFKLSTLYKHMISSSDLVNEHYAEDDCISLLRCANLIGNDFVEFADKNAVPLILHEREMQF